MIDDTGIGWGRLLVALTAVLSLIAGLGFILKYISLRGLTLPGTAARQRRLQIIESLAIDTRRRFVIVQCDGREHLLLLSPARDIVVEANLPPPPSPPAQQP